MLKTILRKSIKRYRALLIVIAALCVLSVLYYAGNTYRLSPNGVKKGLESYVSREEEFFNRTASDKKTILALTIRRDSIINNTLHQSQTGIFAYEVNDRGNPISIYWSTTQMSASPADIKAPDSVMVVKYSNGLFELLKKKVIVNNKLYVIAGMVPLHWHYFIQNKYLPSRFAGPMHIDRLYRLSNNAYTSIAIRNPAGKTLFYLERFVDSRLSQPDTFNTFLHIAIILLIVVFLVYMARSLIVPYTFKTAFGFLVASLFLLRLFVYYGNFIVFTNFSISSELLLGASVSSSDFLISTIFIFVIIAFLFFFQQRIIYPQQYNTFIAVSSLCLLAVSTILICDIVESMLFTLQGSFDITNFFKLSVYTGIGFVILVFIVLTYYYLSWLVITAAYKARFSILVSIAIVVAAGLLLMSFQWQSPIAIIKLAALLWLIGYMLLLHAREEDRMVSLFQSSFFLIWVIVFAVSVSLLVVQLKKNVDFEQRKDLAEKFSRQPDPYSENVLHEAVNSFTDTFLLHNYMRLHNESENRYVKDSLINANFSGYLNKFDTRIYTFDDRGQGLFNDDETTYSVMDNIIRNSIIRYRTINSEGLYFLKNSSNAYSYLYRKDVVSKDTGLVGHIVVVAKPKRYKSDAIYPELFRQAGDIQTELDNYLFAVYEENYLVNYSPGYSFADTLAASQIPKRQFEEHTHDVYSELWYKSINNKIVVLVKKNLSLAEFLTLFALLFLNLILFSCIAEVVSFLMRGRAKTHSISQLFSLNIRTKVQATIILLSFFSFIIIGFITVRFFISRFNTTTQEKLVKTIQVITNEIQDATRSQLIFSDWDQIGTNSDIDRKIVEIASLNNTDINLYDVSGELKLSTQPYIYNRQILSSKMQPEAFDMLKNNHRVLYAQDEYIKDFTFLSMYAPVKNDNDETIAYLNIPYLNSAVEVKQEISNLLVTLINLNAVIFVLASVVAIFLTRSITSSLVQIADKMREFQFGGKIERIEWKRKDEVSALVNTFNQMVHRLEESAEALARSERDGAWQEMARQVAHEIKNPLTPMKLSAQYLQRAIENNASNVKELALSMSATLIEQTDQLAKIAGDFSHFANINQATPEVMNITQLLESLCSLHTTGSEAQIDYFVPAENFFVYADKSQINRLFTNLLKNAEEAVNEDSEDSLNIKIKQQRRRKNVLICISDNGTGISEDKCEHIFEPNFTTKSSGTGLGLAICKRIVENVHGKIWFETEVGQGTMFFVEVPLVDE